MPTFCARDNGWPKKRCYIKKPPTYIRPMCRHWSRGITEKGCGAGMWQYTAKDGSVACFVTEDTKSPETLAPKSKRADVSVVSETNPEGTLSGLERVNSCVEKEEGKK